MVAQSFCSAIQFNRTIDLDEWADLYRILPRETSSEYGQWSTDRFPFLRRIMKCMSPSSIAREIVGMKGAQLGFTELGINWILYNAHCNPGPLGYVQKTDDAVKDFSGQKLKPSIKACDAVRYTLGDDKPVGYANSYKYKAYPGGYTSLGPANSTSFLKSKSWRDGFMDEEDEYEATIGGQGSPRKILQKRMVNFPDRKLVRVSTPVLEELSTIKPGYDEGSQEQYYVPCPHCNPEADEHGFMFLIEWDTIRWSKELDTKTGNPKYSWCECPACSGKIDEAAHKTWMLAKGDWYSTKNIEDPDTPLPRYKVGDVVNPSFRLPSFYSPYGFYSWQDAVNDWHEYLRTRDVNLLQVFINQTCAETFTLVGGDINHTGLYNRRETYDSKANRFDVPLGTLCLTAGADVQDDRIEVEVVGWGLLEENWSVDYVVLPGDTEQMGDARGMLANGRPSVWRLLDEYLLKKFRHETGVDLPIECTMVDCGHKSDQVHRFCAPRHHRRVYPVKGKGGWGNGFFRRAKRLHEKYKTIDYLAFVDELKTKTYAMLTIDEPGPGYCHFPKRPAYDEKHFRALTCERRKTKIVSGQRKLYWEAPSGARNEQLDVRNYATVAFLAYPVNLQQRANRGVDALFGVARPVGPRKPRRRGSPGL